MVSSSTVFTADHLINTRCQLPLDPKVVGPGNIAALDRVHRHSNRDLPAHGSPGPPPTGASAVSGVGRSPKPRPHLLSLQPGLPLCLGRFVGSYRSGVVRAAAARIPAMTERHRALVTAPFRGPGLDTLRSLADVVLDPWIDHQPLRLYNADDLAARVEAEGADLLIVESDSVKGPVLDLPLVAIGSCRGDPNNVDIAAATEKGIPVLRAPGRNADAVAEMAVGAAVRGEPGRRAGRPRRAGGRDLPRRHDPLPALPGLAARGPDRRDRGLRRRRPGRRVALRRTRHEGHQLRPVRARRHPLARRPPRRGRRRVDARRGHARVARDDRRRAVRPHEGRRDLRQHRPRRAARHRRAHAVAGRRPPRRCRSRPLRGRAPRRRRPALLDVERRAHARTSAARPTTPSRTTRR